MPSRHHIYLDHHAHMPASAEHLQQVMALLHSCSGNASSSHWSGRRAKKALEQHREYVADLLQVPRHHIIFVSGATEGNYSVVSSVSQHLLQQRAQGQTTKLSMVLSEGEHPSHHSSVQSLSQHHQLPYTAVPLAACGRIDREALEKELGTAGYVGMVHVNHETGIINPVADIAQQVKERSPQCFVHVDAAQSLGKVDMSWWASSGIDSCVVSGHKIGGLQGVGALYLRQPGLFHGLLKGGAQERGLRAGSENLPGIISLGQRCRHILHRKDWLETPKQLFSLLISQLSSIPSVVVHGDLQHSHHLGCSFSVRGYSAPTLHTLFERAGIALGRGAACSRDLLKPSPILKSMGIEDPLATHAFRVSLGPDNTEHDIKALSQCLQSTLTPPTPSHASSPGSIPCPPP